MLTFLELENYRRFTQYRLNGLARVNLLVGKNNSGKTAILEAMQLLATRGNPSELDQIAKRRDEVFGNGKADLSHFVRGHRFSIGDRFAIRGGDPPRSLEFIVRGLKQLINNGDPGLDEMRSFLSWGGRQSAELIELSMAIELLWNQGTHFVAPVSSQGELLDTFFRVDSTAHADKKVFNHGGIRFVPADLLEIKELNLMWDDAVEKGREAEVVKALEVLESDIKQIFFLSGAASSRRGPLVEVKNLGRFPLGSFGEGMRRMLALALALVTTKEGILLIDEIDTGLHYSIMEDLWLMVVQTAMKHDVQVFATTHGDDCVQGLALLCENHPELAGEVSLQKIDERLNESIAHDAERIIIASEQHIEVR